jgi:hypothetical protein
VFCDLAMMFDQLAYDFKRFEKERRQTSVSSEVTRLGRFGASSSWLTMLTLGLYVGRIPL